ncbi:MAG: hypothetical protein IT222_02560 [Crocinitomix sp.]|nr:hypothetical protein [Crocinitomix sp.]
MIKKYSILLMGTFCALTILLFNLFFINSPSALVFNYGIGFYFGLCISIGSSFVLGKNNANVFIVTLFSSFVFLVYFVIKTLMFYLFNEPVVSEYLTTLICTYLFIYGYLSIYKVPKTNLLLPALLVGSSTFWMEFYPEKIFGVAVVFFGMFFWQFFLSLYLNSVVGRYVRRDIDSFEKNENKESSTYR